MKLIIKSYNKLNPLRWVGLLAESVVVYLIHRLRLHHFTNAGAHWGVVSK